MDVQSNSSKELRRDRTITWLAVFVLGVLVAGYVVIEVRMMALGLRSHFQDLPTIVAVGGFAAVLAATVFGAVLLVLRILRVSLTSRQIVGTLRVTVLYTVLGLLFDSAHHENPWWARALGLASDNRVVAVHHEGPCLDVRGAAFMAGDTCLYSDLTLRHRGQHHTVFETADRELVTVENRSVLARIH